MVSTPTLRVFNHNLLFKEVFYNRFYRKLLSEKAIAFVTFPL